MPYFHPVAYDGYIRHRIYAPNYVKKRHLTPGQSMRAIAHYAKRITTTSTLGHMASGIHECHPEIKLQRAERPVKPGSVCCGAHPSVRAGHAI